MTKQNILEGNGFVNYFITGEKLLVNFDIFNISSNNSLDELPLCIDREEFIMNRKRLYEDNNPNKRNHIKNNILKINKSTNNEEEIEKIS